MAATISKEQMAWVKTAASRLAHKFKRPDLADDLAQETYAIMLREPGDVEHYTQAALRVFTAFRKLSLKKNGGVMRAKLDKTTGKQKYTYVQLLGPERIPVQGTQAQQSRSALMKDLLSRYDQDERIILVLYFVWEMSLEEVGFVLGISNAAVHKQLEYILVRPRKYAKRK